MSKSNSGNFFTNWIRGLPLKRKFSIIIVLIIIVLLIELGNFWFSMRTMSAIRVWVAAEDYWSKGRRAAHYTLKQYSITKNEADYNKISVFLEAHEGDFVFRNEMYSGHYNYSIARAGVIKGGVHPDDVNDGIFLFLWFNKVKYLDEAIYYWATADVKVEEFKLIAYKMHKIISTSYNTDNVALEVENYKKVSALVAQAVDVDAQITILENDFTRVLGEGSRAIKNILLLATTMLTFILGFFIIAIAKIIQDITVQVDNTKNEFVSLASHQLRTPATVVKWYAQALLKEKNESFNEKEKKYIEGIYYGNERTITLINALLNVAHIELGKRKLNIAQVDAKSLLEKIVKTQELEILRKNQKVEVRQIGIVPQLTTDITLLTTILENIISNAIRYTKENGIITCSVETVDSKLLFKITDNGIGIPEKEQRKIFEKLFRASNAISFNTDGNGLGLYIVKKMINALYGRVYFKSELNKGTTFYLELPFKI